MIHNATPEREAARALFQREAGTIEELARSLCRRYALDGDEADGFVSSVMVRMLEDDAAVLRKFQGRSSLRTYLAVVIARIYHDHRTARLGRWRPSAASSRLGPAGILLDACLNRQGYTLEEAVRVVASRDDVDEDEATLREYAARIPRRGRRVFVTAETAATLPAAGDPESMLLEGEADDDLQRARDALERAVAGLPDQDRVMVRLHYWEGLTIAAIARVLRLEQKPLYRRMEMALRRLRASLEAEGIGAEDIGEILA